MVISVKMEFVHLSFLFYLQKHVDSHITGENPKLLCVRGIYYAIYATVFDSFYCFPIHGNFYESNRIATRDPKTRHGFAPKILYCFYNFICCFFVLIS